MTKEEILNTIVALHGPFVLTSEYVSRYSKVSVNVEFSEEENSLTVSSPKNKYYEVEYTVCKDDGTWTKIVTHVPHTFILDKGGEGEDLEECFHDWFYDVWNVKSEDFYEDELVELYYRNLGIINM
tara:strand:- start:173 stop:550 length:378 start_codon:yes stop_codon:yes gene_type:complete